MAEPCAEVSGEWALAAFAAVKLLLILAWLMRDCIERTLILAFELAASTAFPPFDETPPVCYYEFEVWLRLEVVAVPAPSAIKDSLVGAVIG